jgi:TolB protein
MSDTSQNLDIYLPHAAITIEPGGSASLDVYVFNGSETADRVRILVEGLPDGWLSNAQPIIQLDPGQRKQLQLDIHPPRSTQRSGELHFAVRAISQERPENVAEATASLTLSAVDTTPDGNIRLFLSNTQYDLTPGGSTQVVVTIRNQGEKEDRFRIGTEGLPGRWVSIIDADKRIGPGEQAEVILFIQPPKSPHSRAGRYPLVIRAASYSTPENFTTVSANLTIAGYARTGQGQFGVFLWSTEYAVSPGTNTNIPLLIVNESADADNYQVFTEGAPAGWLMVPAPLTRVAPGDQVESQLQVQLPKSPVARAGRYPITVRIVNQRQPNEVVELTVRLTVAAATSASGGSIVAFLWNTQFAVNPGEDVEVPLTVLNRGRNNDLFNVEVSGLPSEWLAKSEPAALSSDDEALMALNIRPPRTSKSRAGRYPFSIQVSSQQSPGQHAVVECTLTLGAYSEFGAEMEPRQIAAGGSGRVIVKNKGNIQQAFTVWLQSEGDAVEFSPNGPQMVRVAAGDSAAAEFTAQPSVAPLFGGTKKYSFSGHAQSADQSAVSMTGEVTARGRIPLWIIPILAIFCCTVIFALGILLQQIDRAQQQNATATESSKGTSIAATVTAELIPPDTPTPEPTATITETPEPTATLEPSTTPNPSETATETPLPTETQTPEPSATATVTETSTPEDTPTATATPLGGSGLLAFSSDRDGDFEIYILDPLTTTLTQLTDNNADDYQSTWRSDGSQIAFVSDRGGNEDIWIMDADGSNPNNIAPNAGTDIYPAWAPDDGKIAFASDRDGNWEIYTINSDGSGLQNVTNDPDSDLYAAWSPDSTQLIFATQRDGNWEIYLIDAAGADPPINLTNNIASDQYPIWSPDGNEIVFASNRSGAWEIYTMNPDGTNQQALTSGIGGDIYDLRWSPDGQLITFTSTVDGNDEIYRMNNDGTGLQNLTGDAGSDGYPAWKPQ